MLCTMPANQQLRQECSCSCLLCWVKGPEVSTE